MNASSLRENSGDCSHHAGQPGSAQITRRVRRAVQPHLSARDFVGVVVTCACILLAGMSGMSGMTGMTGMSAMAQEAILSDRPLGPSVVAPQQPIGDVDGYSAGSEWSNGDGVLEPQAGGVVEPPSSVMAGSSPVDHADGEYVVGDLPQGLCGPATRCQRWTAQVDALMLWQGAIPSRPLYEDFVTKATVLDANQAQPAMSAAPRYALIYHRDACRALEINYFQLQSFAGQATVYPGQNPYAMTNLLNLPFTDIDAAQVTTAGGIKSLEFNLRRSHCDGIVRWLAGFRWVEWNQSMTIADQFTDTGGSSGVEAMQINTGNNLYGGQLGADVMLWNAGNGIKFNGIAKGGVFYNHQAYQTTDVASERGFENSFVATADEPAFVGEVGFNGAIALTNWLSWRAGYTLFWLGGIATPANQLSVTNVGEETTGINSYSSVLLHGVTTGLEARW